MTGMLVAIFLAVLNSLWQAALAAGLVWAALKLLSQFTKKTRVAVNAATRYVIWWVVLAVVLALPIAPRLRQLWTPHAQPPAVAADPLRAPRVFVPDAVETPAAVLLPQPKSAQWPWWIFGLCTAVLVYRLDQIARSYYYLRGLKQRAAFSTRTMPAIERPVRLLLSREVASPMAVGFLHPAVVLPESLIGELSAPELEHVLLHEVAHIARRDDWTNLAARLAGAALAPHPVAWWILRQIEREREIACDDWVVARTGSARPYAASLARLSELRWAKKGEALASGIFGGGSRAGERIELLLRRGRGFSARASGAAITIGVSLMLAFAGTAAFAPRWIAFAQQAPRLQFEVASVKANKSESAAGGGARFLPGGRFTATNVPLYVLVSSAYHVPVQSVRLSGGPEWTHVRSQRFDIEARAREGAIADNLPDLVRYEKMRPMLQALLEDRFHLVMRRETKEVPIYAVDAKNAAKLPRAKIQEQDCPDDSAPGNAQRCHSFSGGQGRGIHGRSVSISDLASFVENWTDRPVEDRTGLRGLYDIDTDGWTPLVQNYGAGAGGAGNGDTDIADPLRPTLFTIFDQIGLKLEPAKAPVEVFLIEHVERPDEN